MKTKFKQILTLLLVFVMQISFAQEKTITGTVSDESGSLPNVSVLVKGTSEARVADSNGKYSIKVKAGDVLVFSYLGYKTLERTVGIENIINVKLEQGSNNLDEVIVLGYGKTTKKSYTGTATVVSKEKLEAKSTHLKHKKSELEAIMAETQKEEEFLSEKSVEFQGQIEERLLTAYNRIRSSVRNGLAVVSIERGASAGSFFTIPPQTQVEIASRKKIITDEHSGRILVDSTLAEEEREKMEKLFSKF